MKTNGMNREELLKTLDARIEARGWSYESATSIIGDRRVLDALKHRKYGRISATDVEIWLKKLG